MGVARRGIQSAIVLFLLGCLTLPVLAGGDFWTKKPYQNWSAEETQRITEDSPWATTLKLSGVQAAIFQGDSPNNRGYRGEMEADPFVSYNIQFRSALPIRQAEVRSSQIGAHYDKMNAEHKAGFDANAAKYLAAQFPDKVLVSVTFQTNVQNLVSQLRNYWASENAAKLSMTVFLNSGKDRLSLLAYSFKDDTFQFTFPRPHDIPPDGKVGVEFVHPRMGAVGEQRILQEFSVKKMMVNGQPSF